MKLVFREFFFCPDISLFSSYKFRLPCQIQHPHCRTAKRQEQKQHPGKLTQKRACAGGLSSTPECG